MMETANILVAEIALNLLGNKFYDLNGRRAFDFETLFNLKSSKTANNNENSDEQENLLDVLGITEADLCVAEDAEEENNIITLDDDDDEYQNNTNEYQNKTNEYQNQFTHSEKTEPQNTELYNSSNQDDRLFYIQSNTKRELIDMHINSSVDRTRFLKDNNLLDDSGLIASANSLSQFFFKEKNTLIAESGALMHFIKLIRNDDKNPKDVLRRVASDILIAKDM